MEIFKLFGSILINTDKADKSLSKTDSSAKKVATTLSSGIKTAGKWAAAIGAAAVGAATGMYKMATNAADTADNIDKMSQKIGISREAYQELDFALSQTGTDVDKLQAGMKTMSKQVEKSSGRFKDLGVALEMDGKARSQEEIFYDTVKALQAMEEGTKKSTIAAELFGKAGTELMPLLNSEAGSLDALRQEAHDLGLVMDDELVDGGVNLTDTLDKMKRSLSAVMTQLGARLMPIVEKVANFITRNIPKINRLIDEIAPIFEDAFDQILPVLIDLGEQIIPQLLDVVKALMPAISRIFQALAPIIAELVQKLVPIIVKIIDKLLPPLMDILEALLPILDIVLDVLEPIFQILDAILDPISDLLKSLAPLITVLLNLIQNILGPIKPLLNGIADLISGVLGGAIEFISGLVQGLTGILSGVIGFLTGDFDNGIEDAAKNMQNSFSNALGEIDKIFGTHLKEWYAEFNEFFEGLGRGIYNALHPDANEPKWTYEDALARLQNDPELNAKPVTTSNFNASDYYSNHYKTPKLASGGVIHGRTLAVVGDNENVKANPEVVAPLSELEQMTGSKEILSEIRETNSLLRQLLGAGNANIVMDGQKIASVVVNRINQMRYTRGTEVVYS